MKSACGHWAGRRVRVGEQRHALGFIRHFAACHHVGFHAAPIPNGFFVSGFVTFGLRFAVIVQHGIAALDVFERAQNRFGRRAFAVQTEMPLQVANPQNQFRDGRGAGIDFQAKKLVRVNGVAVPSSSSEGVAKLRGDVEDFALQNF